MEEEINIYDDYFMSEINRIMNTETLRRYIISAILNNNGSINELKYDTKTGDIFLDDENINYIKDYL